MYFLNRGFSSEILNKYDVGNSKGRAWIPIFDEKNRFVIGATGRSNFEKCGKCRLFHDNKEKCPLTNQNLFSKWRNYGFHRDSILFNYWFANQHIKKSETCILVEGPGDILKLVMAGFHNGVALLGTSLSDYQKIILERSGATKVVICMDPDDAGQNAAKEIKKRLERSFNIYSLPLTNDFGFMQVYDIQAVLEKWRYPK